jgi:hypothetical protein
MRDGVRCLCFCVAAIVAGSARATVTATDDAGSVVTLARPAQRIVSLAPHATELLFAAGAGGRVVGARPGGGPCAACPGGSSALMQCDATLGVDAVAFPRGLSPKLKRRGSNPARRLSPAKPRRPCEKCRRHAENQALATGC